MTSGWKKTQKRDLALTTVWPCFIYSHNRKFASILSQARVEYVAIAVLPMPEVSPESPEGAGKSQMRHFLELVKNVYVYIK